MRILVTGGMGFIGRHLCNYLEQIGHEVVSFDLLADIRNYEETLFILDAVRPDVVYHLAALASVRDSLVNPHDYIDTNITGTLNMLLASTAAKVKQFVFVSSGGTVYGEPTNLPVPDTHRLVPNDIYGLSKLTGEHLTRIICSMNGCIYYNLRYPNVYGPGQSGEGEAGVVAIFAKKMLYGETPIINGDGEQTRDFMFVEDVVRASVSVLGRPPGSYNIGTGVEVSVNQIAGHLCQLTHYQGNVKYSPPKAGEVRRMSLRPSFPMEYTTLRRGLELTVESF